MKVTKVKCNCTNGLPTYAFLFMLNTNIWTNIAPLRDKMLQNVSDLDFETSMSLKVKCESVFGLPIYAFLLMFISNRCPYSAT